MDVPVMFDNLDGSSVENDVALLFQMAIGADFDPPPTVRIDAGVPIKGATWIINGFDWGDDVIYDVNAKGKPFRSRQDAVVHLIQYVPQDVVRILTVKALPNIYTVHNKGETMRTIAKAMYGDARRWTDIKKANPKQRDPNHLKVGTKLRIP
jgi:nucleoid-associated protein YgaU